MAGDSVMDPSDATAHVALDATWALPQVPGFSWAVNKNGLVCGAVIPFENGAPLTTDASGQVRGLFNMLNAALREQGCTATDLVQVVFYVTDMSLRDIINQYWAAWPDHDATSRAVIGVASLAVEGLSIEATFLAMKES